MYRLLTFPILAPILLGLGLLIWHPVNRRVRSIYIMAACLLTSALSFLCIVLTYQHGGDLLACILVALKVADIREGVQSIPGTPSCWSPVSAC